MAFKPFDLTGKVSLITGGNGGIGFGMAEGLAQAGSDIVIWGSNPDKNAAAEAKLKAHGVRVLVQTVDVGDEAQVVAAMAEAEAQMGRLDTVIANAGVGRGAPSFHEMTTDIWRQNMRVNLDGAFWTLREACKSMVNRAKAGDPGGSLMATASLGALQGAARNQAYTATKGALIPMLKGIAVEYARYGIRANAVLPGWVATDMTAGGQGSEKFNQAVIGRVPSRRWGRPDEFAGVAIYLASDAASFHTGDVLLLDGGYSCY
jgi:NAD(P)-dependent dehydrogenase (short-subunit alcohol dehydrogenase family)